MVKRNNIITPSLYARDAWSHLARNLVKEGDGWKWYGDKIRAKKTTGWFMYGDREIIPPRWCGSKVRIRKPVVFKPLGQE